MKNLQKLSYSNFQLATDACETSAKVFKCGVEKDPDGMANLIESSSKNKAEESAVFNIVHCCGDSIFIISKPVGQYCGQNNGSL